MMAASGGGVIAWGMSWKMVQGLWIEGSSPSDANGGCWLLIGSQGAGYVVCDSVVNGEKW